MTRFRHLSARSWPQVCVRRRSPRKSSCRDCSGSSFELIYERCARSGRERRCCCSPDRHVLQRVWPGGNLVVADDQRVMRADLVRQFQQLVSVCRPASEFDDGAARRECRAQAAPQCRSAASPIGAMNRVNCVGARDVLLFDAHHQPVFADGEADSRRRNFRSEASASPS